MRLAKINLITVILKIDEQIKIIEEKTNQICYTEYDHLAFKFKEITLCVQKSRHRYSISFI